MIENYNYANWGNAYENNDKRGKKMSWSTTFCRAKNCPECGKIIDKDDWTNKKMKDCSHHKEVVK